MKQVLPNETATTRDQKRKGNDGKARISVTIAQLILATVLDSSHDIKAGGYCPLFSRETEFHDILSARTSPQLVPVTTRRGVGSRCQPAHAIGRAATATKHEPGLSPLHRVVSYGSANGGLGPLDEIVSLPACTRRSICRGAALASRLNPPTFSGDERGRSKALFVAVLNATTQFRS